MAIRLALLSHHYQEDHMWTSDQLESATNLLVDLRIALSREEVPPTDDLIGEIIQVLSHNLDTPPAITLIRRWVEETLASDLSRSSKLGNPGELSRALDALLGLAI
jgi:L-cysteine:1D-myo-inositol 2-amino-2-deoxy-alpha-D-glucopyranoside ligase